VRLSSLALTNSIVTAVGLPDACDDHFSEGLTYGSTACETLLELLYSTKFYYLCVVKRVSKLCC
jgi:hypothetical protein